MTKLISTASKLAPWKALSEPEQATLTAFVQVMEHHPVYRVTKISGNVADGLSLELARLDKPSHHALTLWYGGNGTGSIKAEAGCFQTSFKNGGDWKQIPVTIDTLATTVGQITDGLLTQNPSAIDAMVTHDPPADDADPRVLAAIRSITESLKGRAEARAKERPKGQLYVWPDTRLIGRRTDYGYAGIYRYMVVLGDKKHYSQNTFNDQHEAILAGLDQLRGLTDDYNYTFSKMDGKQRIADPDRVDVITDRLPKSEDWDKAEEKIKERLVRASEDVASDLARLIEKARKTSEDLSSFGAFADARAFDEYIQEAERAVTAVKRIGLRPSPFRGQMFGPMMFHPGKMPHY